MPWASSSMLDTVRRVNCCETCCKKLSDKSKQVLFWGSASEYKGAKKPHFAPSRQPYTTVGKPSSYLSDSFSRILACSSRREYIGPKYLLVWIQMLRGGA